MYLHVDEEHEELEGLHSCPVCQKLFLKEKAMYLHIMRVHAHGQQMAFDLRADMYMRWQERLPRMSQ